MEQTKDMGDSPAPETGVEEASSGLVGDQIYQAFLEKDKVEAPEPEEKPEVKAEAEQEPDIPEQESTEDEDSNQQPDETEAEEEESEPEDESSLQEEEQRVPYKRLSKEVARRKDLEERLKKAQSRIAEIEAGANQQQETVQAPMPGVTLPEVKDPQALARLEGETRTAIDFLEDKLIDDPDAVDENGDPAYKIQGELYSPKDVKKIVRNLRKKVERDIPEKRQFFTQVANVEAQTKQTFPWLSDTASEDYRVYRSILDGVPGLSQYVGKHALAAAAVEGMKVAFARQQEKPKPVKKETPPTISMTESAPRVRVKDPAGERRKARQSSEAKIMSKGHLSGRDLEQVFLSRQK